MADPHNQPVAKDQTIWIIFQPGSGMEYEINNAQGKYYLEVESAKEIGNSLVVERVDESDLTIVESYSMNNITLWGFHKKEFGAETNYDWKRHE